MHTIFDMDATFRPSKASEYTAMQLCRVLELEGLYEGANTYCFLRGIRVRCHRLSLIPRRIWGLTPEEKFRYLQFAYYIAKEALACEKAGYSLFRCLERPGDRFQDLYRRMLEEIAGKVSETVRQAASGGAEASAGTVRALQRQTARLRRCLREEALHGALEADAERFLQALDRYLEEREEPAMPPLTCWDRLHLLLCYDRDFCWAEALLQACRDLEEALAGEQDAPEDYLDILLAAPRREEAVLLAWVDGAIRELGPEDPPAQEPPSAGAYLAALEVYVTEHLEEVTASVYRKQEVSRWEKGRVLRRFFFLRGSWSAEREAGGRTALTKLELTAAYQVMSFSLASANVISLKRRRHTAQLQTSGRLYRERRAQAYCLRAAQNAPYSYHLLRLWTDARQLRLTAQPERSEQVISLVLLVQRRLLEAVLTGGALVLPRTVRERSRAVEALLGGVLCPGAAEGGAGWF